ncbi:MAG: hypothetical protein VYB30_03425 [Candidatus Thermoplasmatota archaeon]|nr:hypothetical protein [Candidatus Thermoplasmatota archaeon]
MASFDFSIGGIGSLGAMMLIAMVFICYCFAIHLIVTWNPYHRPAIPLVSSLILSIGPMLAMSMEKDGTSSIAEMLEIAFLFTSLGVGVIVLWMPLILLFVTFQMLIVSRKRPSEDPLIEMLEN